MRGRFDNIPATLAAFCACKCNPSPNDSRQWPAKRYHKHPTPQTRPAHSEKTARSTVPAGIFRRAGTAARSDTESSANSRHQPPDSRHTNIQTHRQTDKRADSVPAGGFKCHVTERRREAVSKQQAKRTIQYSTYNTSETEVN